MPEVVSLTEDKIRELLSGWTSVGDRQTVITGLLEDLQNAQLVVNSVVADFENVTLPALQADLAATSNKVSELNDVEFPTLQLDLENNRLAIDNVTQVDIPAIRADIANEIENTAVRPKTYVQPEPPDNPDIDDRDLVVGDTWYDSDDNNKQHLWDGVDWTTFAVDVPNILELIAEYLSPEHILFNSPVSGSTPVVNGANIVPAP